MQEGSSKGITEKNLVRSRAELEAPARFLLETYDQPVIAEAFLPGAEFTCGVLGNGRVGARAASRRDELRLAPRRGASDLWIRSQVGLGHARTTRSTSSSVRPGSIAAVQRAIEDVVLRAYRVLGCRDWSRIDVRLDAHGVPNIVEVNPLPGILPNPADNSCLPKAARAAGLSYDELIQSALVAAAGRTGVHLDAPAPVRTPARTATMVA